MTTHLSLDDYTLQQAAVQLTTAAELLAEAVTPTLADDALRRLRSPEAVSDFLRVVDLGKRALSDAAHSTSLDLADLMAQHDDLDRYLAGVLPVGYAVPGGPATRVSE